MGVRLGPQGPDLVRSLLKRLEIAEIPFDSEHRRVATEAFMNFGKGRHPARLNFGDCMTYATAKVAQKPLLCIGGDFAGTDLELVPLD